RGERVTPCRSIGSEKVKVPSSGWKMGAFQSPRRPCGTRSASHHKVHRLNSGTVASCSVPNGRALAREGRRGQVATIAANRQRPAGTIAGTTAGTSRRSRGWRVIVGEGARGCAGGTPLPRRRTLDSGERLLLLREGPRHVGHHVPQVGAAEPSGEAALDGRNQSVFGHFIAAFRSDHQIGAVLTRGQEHQVAVAHLVARVLVEAVGLVAVLEEDEGLAGAERALAAALDVEGHPLRGDALDAGRV